MFINTSKDVKKTGQNQWKQVGVLFLGTSFLGNGTLGITKAIFSILLKSMGFSSFQIGLISGARGFKAVADIPAGYVSDAYGRKTSAYIGHSLLVLGHWVMGFGSSFWTLFIGRLIHGAGSGFSAGTATFAVADLLKKARGLGQGLLEMANYGAHTIFAIITSVIVMHFGMKAPFFILGSAPLIGIFIIWKYMKEPRDIDSNAAQSAKSSHHALDKKEVFHFIGTLIKDPRMMSIFYVGFLTKFVDEGILTVLLPLWARSQNLSLIQVGSIAALAHGSFTATVALFGYLSDRTNRKTPIMVGILIFGLGCLCIPFATTVGTLTAVAMTIAIGNALVYPAVPAATADVVPEKLRATGMSVYKLVHDIGIFVGPAIMGFLLDHFGIQLASGIAAVIFLFGTVLIQSFYHLPKQSSST